VGFWIAPFLNAPTLSAWRRPQNTKEGSEPIFGEDSFLTVQDRESWWWSSRKRVIR